MMAVNRKIKSILQKNESSASTFKITIWYVIANVFTKGLAMLSTPIFTRILSQNEYGQFSTFTSWESIIMILVTLNFTSSIARAKYDFEGRMNEYISSILICSNVVTFAAYFIIELNRHFFENLFSMDIMYIRMLFVYLLFEPAFEYLQFKHRIFRKYKFFVAFSISSAIIRTLTSILLVLLLKNKLLGRICGYIIPIIIFNFFLWISIIKNGRTVSRDCIIYACRISVPLIPHALSGIVLGSSDRIMITHFCGSDVTALYSVAYSVSMLAALFWNAMNRAWTPWLFDNINAGNEELIRKNSKIYLGIFTYLIMGVLLITPEIILILGGQKYYSARYVMPPVILGCAFQFVYGMYVNIETYEKKTFIISLGTTSAAILNIVLNWIFIPKYGYMAAAYTTMLSYFALFAFHYLIVKLRIKKYYNTLFDNKFVFLMIAVMLLFWMTSYILYQYNIIRYVLIAVYVLILWAIIWKKYGKTIKNLIKR